MSLRRVRSAGRLWLERLRRGAPGLRFEGSGGAPGAPDVLAFHPSAFLGVAESTRRAFEHAIPLDASELLLRRDREAVAAAIAAAAPDVVVFSGFVDGYAEIARRLRSLCPERSIYVLWHGTPLQLADLEERRQYDSVLALAREGVVARIGCLKTGEAADLSRRGLAAVDVFNPPPDGEPRGVDAKTARRSDQGPLRLGLFAAGASWRRNPYAQLAAASRVGAAVLSGLLDAPARAYARSIGVELGRVRPTPWPRGELEALAAAQDCNLYVSLSECSPLFPIESLHWGVPCVIGPTSHLFAASPVCVDERSEVSKARVEEAGRLLERRLVVPRPEDPDTIARYVCEAVDAREEILEAYADWQQAYGRAARSSIESLVRPSSPSSPSSPASPASPASSASSASPEAERA